MPSAGLIHFYVYVMISFSLSRVCVNALGGLNSFLQTLNPNNSYWLINGVNALGGLNSFLQYPLGTRINTGFPGSFLQVFVRIF